MGSGDEQLSLFGSIEGIEKQDESQQREENTKSKTESIYRKSSLDKKYCEAVEHYLSGGVESALEISEKLIKEHGAEPERFLSGKPKIFVGVCQYLENLANVKMVEAKEDRSDRKYGFEI